MSDMDRFIELYKSVGIELEPTQNIFNNFCGATYALQLEEGRTQKISGYTCFLTVLYFDAYGRFIEQAVWS